MDSRQRFVVTYALVSLIPFTVLSLLNSSDLGLFAIAFIIIYFVLRLVLNPKTKFRVDFLSLVLLVIFVYLIEQHIVPILG